MDNRSRTVNQERQRITREILSDMDPDERLSLASAIQSWWSNTMPNGGFRLTDEGYEVMTREMGHPGWSFCVTRDQLNTRMLLDLDQRVQCPFYIDHRRGQVFLFGSAEAMMVKLQGDLGRWVRMLPHRQGK